MIYLLSVFLLVFSFADRAMSDISAAAPLKGIILVESLDLLSSSQLAEVSGIEALGFALEEANYLKSILEPLCGKKIFTQEIAEEIKKVINEYYVKNQQQVLIEISLQNDTSDVLQVVIKKIHPIDNDVLASQNIQQLDPNPNGLFSAKELPDMELGFEVLQEPLYSNELFSAEESLDVELYSQLPQEQSDLSPNALFAIEELPDMKLGFEVSQERLDSNAVFADEELLDETWHFNQEEQVLIKAIVLVSDQEQISTHLHERKAEGIQIFLDSEDLGALADDLSVYLQQPLNEEVLCEIEQTIFSYYYNTCYPFVLVEFPNQDVTNGILHIVVCESTLGEICIEPNESYTVHKIMDYIRLCPGERINESILFNDVAWLNRNPFRQIDIIYQPGEEEGKTDILLQANARRRFRLYGGADNAGVKSIQRERFFAGFNITDYNQMFTYQYTSSFNTKRFQAHTVQYTLPCAWRNVLNIYGGYARVRPNLPLPVTRNKGWGMQTSLRYVIPLKTYSYLTHEISAGGDFKRTNNTVEFSDNSPTIANNVNLTQLMLEYKGTYSGSRNRVDYQIQGFCSPGKWLADQTNALYSHLRPNAKNHWVYGRLNCTFSQKLPKDFYFSVGFSGQLSNQNLLPSEQFYTGGYDTVRGYDERELNADTGLFVRTEIYAPPLIYTPPSRVFDECYDKLELLVFFDYGYANNHTPIPPEGKSNHLMSVGPGLRYAFSNYCAVRLDYGIQLYHKKFFGSNHQRVHFGVIASY